MIASVPEVTVVVWSWEDGWTLERSAAPLDQSSTFAEFCEAGLASTAWLSLSPQCYSFLFLFGPGRVPEAVLTSCVIESRPDSRPDACRFYLPEEQGPIRVPALDDLSRLRGQREVFCHLTSLVEALTLLAPDQVALSLSLHDHALRLASASVRALRDWAPVLAVLQEETSQSAIFRAFRPHAVAGHCPDRASEASLLLGVLPGIFLPGWQP